MREYFKFTVKQSLPGKMARFEGSRPHAQDSICYFRQYYETFTVQNHKNTWWQKFVLWSCLFDTDICKKIYKLIEQWRQYKNTIFLFQYNRKCPYTITQIIYGTSKSWRFIASFTIVHLFLSSASLWNPLI